MTEEKEYIKIVCKCKNCGKEFVAEILSVEEFTPCAYQKVYGTVWVHGCQGNDGPVVGIGETIRLEEIDTSSKK